VVKSLAQPWCGAGVTHVAGVEACGFLLGAPCALVLTAGFVAIRKDYGLLPGQKVFARTECQALTQNAASQQPSRKRVVRLFRQAEPVLTGLTRDGAWTFSNRMLSG
jgi:adenine/guanine phosphoribosyltransferase-like PRPP-binding protein